MNIKINISWKTGEYRIKVLWSKSSNNKSGTDIITSSQNKHQTEEIFHYISIISRLRYRSKENKFDCNYNRD